MNKGATIGHTAVKVKDINGMIKMMEDLLGFHVSRKMGMARSHRMCGSRKGCNWFTIPISEVLRGGCTTWEF